MFFSFALQHLLAASYPPLSHSSRVDILISLLLKRSDTTFSYSMFKLDSLWWNEVSIARIHMGDSWEGGKLWEVRFLKSDLLSSSIVFVWCTYWLALVCLGEFNLFCDCEAPCKMFGELLHFYAVYIYKHKVNKTLLCDTLPLKVKLLLVFIISQQLHYTVHVRSLIIFPLFQQS